MRRHGDANVRMEINLEVSWPAITLEPYAGLPTPPLIISTVPDDVPDAEERPAHTVPVLISWVATGTLIIIVGFALIVMCWRCYRRGPPRAPDNDYADIALTPRGISS
jgi:hypothetical protein